MKRVLVALFVLLASIVTLAQDKSTQETTVKRASDAVSRLHDEMRDPDSFVLEGVFITATPVTVCETKWCKHKTKVPVASICYSFRSHNAYGGYGDGGLAVLKENNTLAILDKCEQSWGHPAGYCDSSAKIHLTELSEPELPCQSKNTTADITAEVKAALAPPASTPVSPADAAAKAQQYADCMKVAVNNPSIVSKEPK